MLDEYKKVQIKVFSPGERKKQEKIIEDERCVHNIICYWFMTCYSNPLSNF